MTYQNEVRNVEEHTEADLQNMPLAALRALAIREAQEAARKQDPQAVARTAAQEEASRQSANNEARRQSSKPEANASANAEVPGENEVFVVSKTLDIGEGAGVETFNGEGATREEALENLLEKISEAKLNATKKIRSQEARIRKLEEQRGLQEISEADELMIASRLQTNPTEGLNMAIRMATNGEIDLSDLAETAKSHKKWVQGETTNNEINQFLASHEDYIDDGEIGVRNSSVMKMKLAELRLVPTAENLQTAYLQLAEAGLLQLRDGSAGSAEAVSPREQEFQQQRPPAAQPAAQRPTRRSSGITSQNTNRATPRVGLSEADAYGLSLEELRKRANQQLAERNESAGTSSVEGYVSRQSGIIADRVR